MMKEESGGGTIGNNWARVCDTCHAAACTVYCRADSAYLCMGCDARVHAANKVASRHERVWVCEACERAPAAFLCKADAASLCVACDVDIHSANPLAQRHQRMPILPITGCVAGPHEIEDGFMTTQEGEETVGEEEEDEAASWLLPNPEKNGNNNNYNQGGNGFLFDEEVDEYLDDIVEYNSCGGDQNNNQYPSDGYNHQQFNNVAQKSYVGDSVVPVQYDGKDMLQLQHHQYHNFQMGLDFESSKPKTPYSYNGTISHSASISSLEIGEVPDSAMSDLSISQPRAPKGTLDLFSGPPMNIPSQLSPMDREARVLRYREKKKTRKFEKTIRYASRKAYAETRPRIKGRFAKRTDVDIEVDQMFSTSLMAETGYSIVPSF